MSINGREKWVERYRQVALEVDAQKMPERIADANRAITERLRELEGNSDHHAERQEIETALTSLTVVEKEAQNWQ